MKLIIITVICFLPFMHHLYADDNVKAELIELQKKTYRITTVFKNVFKLVSPSVVRIKMKDEGDDVSSSFMNSVNRGDDKEFNLYKTFKLPDKDVGSGFIIDKSGLIVTNYHVINKFNEKEIEVTLYNNKKYKAEIVGFDPQTDLALIKINGKEFKPVTFEEKSISETGDWVIAIGNPYGHRQTMSTGIISASGFKYHDALPTTLTYDDFIQTDASINPGCSGGPLLNMRGEVIGINAAIATRRGGFQGIGFAIPAVIVKKVVNDLKEKAFMYRGDAETQRKD